MSPRELDEACRFAATHTQVFLLGRTASGGPVGYPMVGRYADGGIEFSTYRKSAKVAHVLRTGRSACLIVPRPGATDRRSLWVAGAATIRHGDEGLELLGQTTGRGTSGIEVPSEIVGTVRSRHDSGKRCIIRVEIDEARFAELPEDA